MGLMRVSGQAFSPKQLEYGFKHSAKTGSGLQFLLWLTIIVPIFAVAHKNSFFVPQGRTKKALFGLFRLPENRFSTLFAVFSR
ncbi:hypothetical protein L1281_000541 [Neisseria sp. HSC-16F19]|nr:hypothetical protein [Neisseria sp. HSC-16F19]MCP2039962.1 hypothetical protein [Neisseria sp. HSC-16F19]